MRRTEVREERNQSSYLILILLALLKIYFRLVDLFGSVQNCEISWLSCVSFETHDCFSFILV